MAEKNPLPDSVPAKDPNGEVTEVKESETKNDPKSSVITEKNAKPAKNPGQMKNAEPVKDPGPVKDSGPDSLKPKNTEPEKKELPHTIIPEKSVVPDQDSGPVIDPVQPPEPEKVPEIIQKFLKRRKNGLEKDPEPE